MWDSCHAPLPKGVNVVTATPMKKSGSLFCLENFKGFNIRLPVWVCQFAFLL